MRTFKILAISALAFLSSCTTEEHETIENTVTIEVGADYVSVDGTNIDVDQNGDYRSDNYNVIFYESKIHVFSLKEYYIRTLFKNSEEAPIEEGTMFFVIKDPGTRPVEIKFISIPK